jgi:hypothetical protein
MSAVQGPMRADFRGRKAAGAQIVLPRRGEPGRFERSDVRFESAENGFGASDRQLL